MEEGSDTTTENDMETSADRAARKEREERLWNKQWALDKSIEWCKHMNEILITPEETVTGKLMTSEEVCQMADIFYYWLYKDTK